MKLNYSDRLHKGLNKALFFFLFILPVYTFSQNCTVNANADRTICPGGATALPPDQFYLLGTANTAPGTNFLVDPVWSQIAGPAVQIVDPNLQQTLVTGAVPGNSYTFRLTAQCADGSTVFDDIVMVISPLTLANAGTDQTYCQGTYALNANAVGGTETGTWSVEGNNNAGVTVNSPNSSSSTITVSGNSSGSTTLRWTITNGSCTSTDDVVISSLGGRMPVTAGADITLSKCYSSTQTATLNGSFGGNTPGQQQGTWTVVSGPSIPSFTNANRNNTSVTGLLEGTYVFRWTVAGICANGVDEMTVIVPPPTADVTNVSGSTAYFCDGRTSTILQGNIPLYVNESVQWTQTGGPTAVIQNPTSPSTVVSGMTALGTYTFLYTLTNSVTNCVTTANYVVVLEDIISISGGPNQTLGCDESEAIIPVTFTGNGQMSWQLIDGPAVNPILNPPYPSFPTSPVNFSGNSFTISQLTFSGTYVVRLIKAPNPGSQCETIYNTVVIVVSAQPTNSSAGTMQIVPCNSTSATLAGNLVIYGKGTWSQISGPSVVTFSDINSSTTKVSPLINGGYKFRWTISGGPDCDVTQSTSEVLVSSVAPTTANAGNDQAVCFGSTIQLQGNAIQNSENGTWTVSPNAGVVFSDQGDPNSTVSGLAANTTYTFTWTIANGCGTSADTVDVVTNNTQGADADAGADQCLPAGTNTITLNGNNPVPGTGLWTQTAGNAATITNPTLYNTTVTGLSDGDYAFKWTVSNVGCTDGEDTVGITIAPTITAAQAGMDQSLCSNSTTVIGNTPASGESGLWELVSGGDGPVITNPTNPTTTITGLTPGSWVYKWTISKGFCASTSDTVKLNIDEAPSPAIAGPDQTVCNQSSVILGATPPLIGRGIWSLISGPNSPVFSDARSATSTLSGLITGEYILEWATYTGINCPTNRDQVTIKVTEVAAAGSDFATCLEGPLFLVGNAASTGTWTYVSGGVGAPTITTTSNNSAAVTNLVPGVYVFRYTIAVQGLCPESSDDIQVTVNGQIVTPPNAGPDQEYCDAGANEIQLAASALDPGTTGKWTKLFGPAGGSFVNDTDPNTIFTNPGYGFYVFNWTVSSGTCSESDQIRIENSEPPSTAMAGGDNVICGSVTNLTAIPPLSGVGKWTQVSGPTIAVFSSEISPNTTVSNLTQTGGVYVFRWTVTNGALCPSTTDTVQITVTADLTVPKAGPDQTICVSDSATLAANAITAGTGQWSKVSGPAGSFSDVTSPTSLFTPSAGGSYVLRWTATNLSCVFFDEMTLIVSPLPSTSNAGTPISICEFQTLTLAANTPIIGTGLWTQVSGPTTAVFTAASSPTTTVLGTQPGVYIFTWTISNGLCAPSSSNVTVTINALPPLADAGPDQIICNTGTVTLNGNNPVTGIGTWTFVTNPGGTALITNPNAFNTTVTNISVGITRLKWTISNGSCNSYADEVNIVRPSDLILSTLTSDTTICQGGTTTLTITPTGSIAPYTYQWQTSADGVTGWTNISGQTNAAFTTNSALTNGEYYYRVNVSSTCTQVSSNVAKLTIIPDPVVTLQPTGSTICSGGTHTMTVAATTTNIAAGTIVYQWQSSVNGTSGWTNVSDGSGANTATYTTAALTSNLYFRVQITQSGSGCETFSNSALVNVARITTQPTTPAAVCVGGIVSINIAATLDGGAGTLSYQWQSNSGAGFVNETNPTATTANFTSDILNATTQFRCLITSSTTNCILTSNTVTATVVPDPAISVQPTGGIVCSGGAFTLSVSATGGTPSLNYQWYSSLDNLSFTLLSGATSSAYTTPALTQDTYYRVDVSAAGSGCGLVSSNSVLMDVIPNLVVNQQPVGNTICSGGTHTMTVVASGDPSGGVLVYQWQRSANGTTGWANTTGGSGATTASYTTGALASTFYYRVRVTQAANGCEVYSDAVPVFVATITTQPATPANICIGGIVSINIAASLNGGTGTLSYQWQSNPGSGFVNETNATATTANFTSDILNATTQFRCLVTSSTTNCTITSNIVTATVVPDPSITVQPAGTTICSGGNHTLSVTGANGTPSLTYQWFSSTNNATFTAISGATSATYTTPALTQTTYYKVDISASGSGCNTITSNVATVTVLSAITIITQPVVKTNICSGSNATLNVVVGGGSGNYSYQWKNSTLLAGPYTNITGANSASYSTPNLTQTTFYQVTISDSTQGCTPVVSGIAAVIIPSIETQPVNPTIVCVGGTVSISTAASANNGSASFSYQWQRSADGVSGWANITGEIRATNPNYISGPLATTTYYRCVITSSNPTCTLITNAVVATVIPDPTISTQPIGGNICEGGVFTMTSGAQNGSGNFTYQWQKSLDGATGWANVTDGSGANTTTYTTGFVNADAFYRLHVTDSGIGCGVINSNPAKVDVFEIPIISTQPKDGEACINETHNFTVVATGNIPASPLLYQWQTATVLAGPYTDVIGGTGGTTTSYTTPTYATAGNRYFRVIISQAESGCRTVSNHVMLKVFDLPAAPVGSVTQQPSCANATGTVSIVNPDLGTGYEYSSDGITFQASNVFAGLTPGAVTIYVRRVGLNTCISSGTTFTIFNRICAVPENFTAISGDTGGSTAPHSILDSDTINGVILNPSAVNVTINSISSYLTYDFNPLSRTISVAPGTPPGDYTLTYTICEIVNPGNLSDPANFVNCSTTTETISVTTAGIDARIDIVKYIVNGYTGANNVINALTNDTLGGAQATLSNVTLSVVNPALPINPLITAVPFLDITTGNVSVPPGTVKGLYEIEYKICEIGAPLNCDTALIIVPVGNALIVANDDRVENINGYLGLMNAANALTNDTLNGVPITGANFNEITISQNLAATPLYPGANVPVFSTATGSISIPAGTPANTYFITYTICEKLNPTNCADGSIAVVVKAAPLIVNDDRVDNINGYDGGVDAINVYTNVAGADTFDGQVININLANVLTPSIVTPAQPKAPGAPVPVLDVSTGFVTVPPGTPAGQYQIKYQICEDLNPGNCDDATVIINVVVPIIEANDDTVLNVNGYEGADDVINIYDNDFLNGGMLDLPDITTTVISTPAPINGGPVPTLDSITGLVDVPAGTPAGEYKFVYKICENLNPMNCDQAVVTIVVVPALINAENDANFAPINGFVGSPNALNALDNDTLNGMAVNPSEVIITNIIPATPINGGLVPVLNGTTGNVSVPPGTAAGLYFIGYQLNEKLNLSNNDFAIITVEVSAPPIVANDDTIANVNGYVNTTNAIDVLLNDTLNGVTANVSKVTITVDVAATPINGGPIPVLEPLTGFVSIPAGTPAGDYEIQYHICEKINPLNCDNATVFITVTGPQIDAVNDAVANINGFTGATNAVNALTNDTLNGMTVISSQVTISNIVPALPINGGAIPVLNPSNGNVDVPSGTAAGTYIIGYRLSENLNPANFDTATITIDVIAPSIIANADSTGNINGYTGANNAVNAITNDRLNGSDIQLIKIDITSVSTTTPVGYVLGNPVPVLNIVTGNVNVPPGTSAGTYVIHYRICEKLNPLNCSEADITINVIAPIIDANNDFVSNINGYSGANNVVNALTNDTLNGVTAQAAQVNITVLSTTPPVTSTNGIVPVLNTVTGNVDVPAGTSAGTYFIQYEICEKINPNNCSQATIIIIVNAPSIVAEDDTITNINGLSGTNNILNAFTSNDKYNGVGLTDISLIIPTILSTATSINGGMVPVLDITTGLVSIPAGTPAGAYQIRYRICDKLNPSNCDDAVINIVVSVPVIIANDDTAVNINGYTGASNVLNAYTNDTLNGTAILQTNSNSTLVTAANSINGAVVPVLNVFTGNVDVPAGTTPGEYSIVYKICDKLNPSNCDEAVIRITVIASPIDAVDDNVAGINGVIGTANAINALDNDTLNGVKVIPAEVIITNIIPATVITSGLVPVLDPATGIVSVPAGTSAGTYTITYTLREKAVLTNSDTAVITIIVGASTIEANDDTLSNINGYVATNNAIDVVANDRLNGAATSISKVEVTVDVAATPLNGGPVPVLEPLTGMVSIPARTPAGNYQIKYHICERLNPANCNDATVFVNVIAAPILAVNDTANNVNGLTGATNVVNSVSNDLLNGVAAVLSEIKIKVITAAASINSGPVPALDILTGNVNVPAGTSSGTYTIRYEICEVLNQTNCSQADIVVNVTSGPIIANDDTATGINGLDGVANAVNVLTNDLLDGVAPTLAQVKINVVSPADSINSAPVPVLNTAIGLVSVPPGTSAGIYTIVYEICQSTNTLNCDRAVIKITVAQPSIRLVKQGVFSDGNGDGYAQPGEQIRYSFVITNTGTLDLNNVIVTDPKATVTGTPIAVLAVGQSNTTSFKGTYVLTQADINRGYVENQALVTAQPVSGSSIQDLSDSNDLTLIGPNDPTITPVPQHKELTLIKGGELTGNGGVGSVIKYTFKVKNTGNVVVTNLAITDPMLTATAIAVTPNVLVPGATGTATASYTVTLTDVANGEVINSALVIGDDPQGNPVIDISDSDDPALTGDDDPTVVDLDLKPSIALIKTATFNDENKNGYAEIGETITYHFSVTNTGNILLVNVVVKDPKPGITITGGPVILKHGETNSDSFVGTYVLTAADIEAGSVENQAEVTAVSPDGKTASDLSDGNSILGDNPTVLPINSCKVTIYNAVSPNGDGINDIFKIKGIECYTDAYVEIYDRWGVLVYDAYGYDNASIAFRGISEGRATVNKQKGLPVGTYFYVITYKTYLNEPVSLTGYLYLSR